MSIFERNNKYQTFSCLNELASYQYKEAKQIMETGSKEDIIKLISDYEKQLDHQRSYRLMIFKMINVYKSPKYRSTRLILLQISAHSGNLSVKLR